VVHTTKGPYSTKLATWGDSTFCYVVGIFHHNCQSQTSSRIYI